MGRVTTNRNNNLLSKENYRSNYGNVRNKKNVNGTSGNKNGYNKRENGNNNNEYSPTSQDDYSQKKDMGGKYIRTSGYRHKKRRNKFLFVSDDDSPSQVKYNYKYERVNSEKKREKKLEEMMQRNQSSNVENNQGSSNNKRYNKKSYNKNNNGDYNYNKYEYNPIQLYTFYKDTISEKESSTEEKNVSVNINKDYPLNHLYEAFNYLGQSKSIRKAKAWYDSQPMFSFDNNNKTKNGENKIGIKKFSISVASVYALNYSPKSWHLIDYYKRNPKTSIKASAELSKNLKDQAAELEKKKNRKQSVIEDKSESLPISLINYPPYNPFEAEDGVQEDYEPYYDYQAKLNKFIKQQPKKEKVNKSTNINKGSTKLNVNAKSFVPRSMAKSTDDVDNNLISENTPTIEILSGTQIWNNYIKSTEDRKIRNAQIRSNSINILKEGTQRRIRMVQRPSKPSSNKKQSVTFKLDPSTNYSNKKQNSTSSPYKKQYNNKKYNKNSTYAKYVASYSVYNDFNKLMQPNNGRYPVNYKNAVERINNYYSKGGFDSQSPVQQPNNNTYYNNYYNNTSSYNNNYNNNTTYNNNYINNTSYNNNYNDNNYYNNNYYNNNYNDNNYNDNTYNDNTYNDNNYNDNTYSDNNYNGNNYNDSNYNNNTYNNNTYNSNNYNKKNYKKSNKQNNNKSNQYNENNYNNRNNSQQQQNQNNKSKPIYVNTSNNNKFKSKASPSGNNSSPQSYSSPSKSPVKQNKRNSILKSGNESPQQYYFSNSYSYGSNLSNNSSFKNKPKFFNQTDNRQKNYNNETMVKNNKESTRKFVKTTSS